MGSKGSSSSSQPNATSSYSGSSPPPNVLAAYNQIMNQAGTIASQPLQQYSGPLVAGFNPTQETAFNQIDNSTGLAQPAINAGEGLVAGSAAPITPEVTNTTEQFMSPYLNTAVGATAAQQENINEQQQEQLTGQAIGAGAYGGDRAGVAAGELANQQDLANNQVIAGMENTGYNTAAGEAINTLESDASRQAQAGTELGALGNEAQSASLAGANAQLGAGTLQQQLAQENLNVPYEEFVQQQAYPYQTTGWLAGIDEALGSLSGGTSYSTPTPPNPYSEYGGLALAGLGTAGLFGAFNGTGTGNSYLGGSAARGGRIQRDLGGRLAHEHGGLVSHMVPLHRDSGGLVPIGSYVPTINSTGGKGPPNPVANSGKNLTTGVNPLADLGSVEKLINAGKKTAAKTAPKDDSETPVGSDDQGNPINADGQPIGGNTNTGGLSVNDSDALQAQQDYENSLPGEGGGGGGDGTRSFGDGPPELDLSDAGNAAAGVDMNDLAAASEAADSASAAGDVMDVMAMRKGGRTHRDLGGATDPDDFDSAGYTDMGNAAAANAGNVSDDVLDAQYIKLLSGMDEQRGGRIHKDDGGSAGDDAITLLSSGDDTTSLDLGDNILPSVPTPSDPTGGDSSTHGAGPPQPQKIDAGTTTTSGGSDNTLGDIASVAEIAMMFAKHGGRIHRDLGGPVPPMGAPGAGGMDPRAQMLQRLAMQKSMMPNAMPPGATGMAPQPSIGPFSASPLQTGGGMASAGGPVSLMNAGAGFAEGGLARGGLLVRGYATDGAVDDDYADLQALDDGGEEEAPVAEPVDVDEAITPVTEEEDGGGGGGGKDGGEGDAEPEEGGLAPRSRTSNPWLALASAGFGMAGSGSPFLGQGLAEGAQAGLKTLGQQADADLKAQKLKQDADKAAKQFAAQEKHYSVMQTNAERTAKAAEATAAAKQKIAEAAEANKDADRELKKQQALAAQRRADAALAIAHRGNYTEENTTMPDPNDPTKTIPAIRQVDKYTGKSTTVPGSIASKENTGANEHAVNTWMTSYNASHPDAKIDYATAAQMMKERSNPAEAHNIMTEAQNYARNQMNSTTPPMVADETHQGKMRPKTYEELVNEGLNYSRKVRRDAEASEAPVARPVATPVARPAAAPVAVPAVAAPEQPPVPGARKARDGNWYVTNPQQPDPSQGIT
jgi:hypothetical protein